MNQEQFSQQTNNESGNKANRNLLIRIIFAVVFMLVLVIIVFVILLRIGVFNTAKQVSSATEQGLEELQKLKDLKQNIEARNQAMMIEGEQEINGISKVPIIEDETMDWDVFISNKYNYSFKYPSGAEIVKTSQDEFSLSPEEFQNGVTFEDKYSQYAGDVCVTANYGLGYVKIVAPDNSNFEITTCGMRTGIGAECTIEDKDDLLEIGGKSYKASGRVISCEVNGKMQKDEEFSVKLDNGGVVVYNILTDEDNMPAEYQETLNTLKKIIGTLKLDNLAN